MTTAIGAQSELAALLTSCRVLPVATVEDAEHAEPLARALLAGGLRCVEVVFRSPAAAEAIARIAAIDGIVVGAGTVLTPAQVETAADAGARFLVSPVLDGEVVVAARERGVPHVPGVATPSEIQRARALGLRLLKLFPARELGGPAFVRAVAPVFPDVRFVPTGGIDAANARDYLALSPVVACGGSWLVRPELLREGRFDEIERLAREAAGLLA